MKNVFNIIITVLAIILVIDLVCFCAWVASGQVPSDGFFFGRITKEIIAIIL